MSTPTKFRAHDWFNTKTGAVRLGVQGCINGKWLNVGTRGKRGFSPKFFRSEANRTAWISKENARLQAQRMATGLTG